MNFLKALLAQLSIGLVYRLGVPTLGAMIVEHYVLNAQIDDSFTRYPHAATFVIAGLFSSVCAALIASTKAVEGDPTLSITTRTCVFAAIWFFIRLALHQEQSLEAVVFFVVALWLLLATFMSLISLPARSIAGGYALYGTAAAVLVLFGVYVSGQKVLLLERHLSTVTAEFNTYRWLGARHVSQRSTAGVTGVVSTFQSKRFGDHGDAYVLQGDDEVLLFPFESEVMRPIDRFLRSAEPSLTIVEPTSTPWRLGMLWLVASTALWGGLTLDPAVAGPVGKPAKLAARIVATNFVIALAVVVFLSASFFWHLHASRNEARRRIELLGCTVEDADLTARGATLFGSAWRVKARPPKFDDARLRELIPLLKEAPGLSLDLSHTYVTDTGVKLLADVDYLIMLNLQDTEITGAGLPPLKDTDVRYLDVRDTLVRAPDVRNAALGNLEYLLFSDSRFSQKSVNYLLEMKRLKYVFIDTAALTVEDLKFWKSEVDFEIEVPDVRAEVEPR